MKNIKRPICGYVRVSTNMQGETGSSLDAQREAIKNYAVRNDCELIGIWEDVESGCKDRAGLNLALSAAAKSKGTLLVLNISRLGRTVLSSLKWIEMLKKRGANFASIHESVDTTSPIGNFQLELMISLSAMEAAQIRSKVTFTMAHLRKKNKRISRFTPYGYTLSDDGQTLIEVEPQQLILKRIEAESNAGRSLREIANGLNADGVKTSRGCEWKRGSIYQTLVRIKKLAA